MVSDELITLVKEKFQEGKRRSEIKEELWNEGYSEEDVDAAISQLQHDIFRQLPVVSWIYQSIERFEKNQNLATPRMTIIIMAACIGVLVLLAGGLFMVFDPLGTQSVARDARRQSDITALQSALSAYYKQNYVYPSTLTQLVPNFISAIPKDPKSHTTYSYHTLNSAENYELCVSYELQQIQCLSAKPVTSNIPVVPTATPIPTFTPHSASGNVTGK